MASPLETPLQEVEGEGRVLRGDGDLARSTSPGDCLPPVPSTGPCPAGCSHGMCSRLLLSSSLNGGGITQNPHPDVTQSPLCLPSSAVRSS